MAEEPEKTEGQQAEGQEAEGQTEGQAEGQQAEGEAEPQTVPYERFQEMQAKVKQLEEQAEVAAQQQAIARAIHRRANLSGSSLTFLRRLCEDDDDVLTVKQHRQVIAHHATVFDRRIADLAFFQAHPDYAQIVGTADEIASGKYAEPLAAAIKQNPALLNDIAKSPHPKLAAYNIAKLQKEKSPGKSISNVEAKNAIDEAVENANRVKSSANAKGGEALSEAGRYENMSDKDFVALALSNGAII